MSGTFTLHVDGEEIVLEVEELSRLEQIQWAARAPPELKGQAGEDPQLTPAALKYLITIVEKQTVLERELLEDLPHGEMGRLFEAVVKISFGEDISHLEKDNIEGIESDSYEDLDDWR